MKLWERIEGMAAHAPDGYFRTWLKEHLVKQVRRLEEENASLERTLARVNLERRKESAPTTGDQLEAERREREAIHRAVSEEEDVTG